MANIGAGVGKKKKANNHKQIMAYDQAKVGNWLDSIIQAGTVVFASTQQPHNQAVSITSTISGLVSQLNQIEVAYTALSDTQKLVNGAAVLQGVGQIQASLGQLHGTGSDAGYLQTAITTAAAVLRDIQADLTRIQNVNNTPVTVPTNTPINTPTNAPIVPTTQPTATNTVPIVSANGSIVYVPMPQTATNNGQLINGVDNIYLFGGVGLLVAVLLLKK